MPLPLAQPSHLEFPDADYEVFALSCVFPFMALHYLSYCDVMDAEVDSEEQRALFLYYARTAIREGQPNTTITLDETGNWTYFKDDRMIESVSKKRQVLNFLPFGFELLEELIELENQNLEFFKINRVQKHTWVTQMAAKEKEVEYLKERDRRTLEVHLEMMSFRSEQEREILQLTTELQMIEKEKSESRAKMAKLKKIRPIK